MNPYDSNTMKVGDEVLVQGPGGRIPGIIVAVYTHPVLARPLYTVKTRSRILSNLGKPRDYLLPAEDPA